MYLIANHNMSANLYSLISLEQSSSSINLKCIYLRITYSSCTRSFKPAQASHSSFHFSPLPLHRNHTNVRIGLHNQLFVFQMQCLIDDFYPHSLNCLFRKLPHHFICNEQHLAGNQLLNRLDEAKTMRCFATATGIYSIRSLVIVSRF